MGKPCLCFFPGGDRLFRLSPGLALVVAKPGVALSNPRRSDTSGFDTRGQLDEAVHRLCALRVTCRRPRQTSPTLPADLRGPP